MMRVLIAGAGVIGTVYGAHLGAAGNAVSVLRHPPRTGEIAWGLPRVRPRYRRRSPKAAANGPDRRAGAGSRWDPGVRDTARSRFLLRGSKEICFIQGKTLTGLVVLDEP
jgi:hypothetical protein